MTKYKVGDQVKIVNYGSSFWWNPKSGIPKLNFPIIYESVEVIVFDMNPELVGQVGVVSKANTTQNIDNYAIEGIKDKHAWYHNDQLELVYRPEYNE
jgi:hypothetical protein